MFCRQCYVTLFPLASNMLSYIDIFQDIVLKLEIPVLWQH